MKKNNYIAGLCFVLLSTAIVSCDKDGDFLTTSGGSDVTLDGSISDIILDYDHIDALALTVHWNDNGEISLNNPLVAAPENAVSNTIQLAGEETFSSTVDYLMDAGVYQKQFTVGELNNAVGRVGLEGGVKSPLYIRIKSVIGVNMEPKYSNVLKVNVMPYVIDMSVGFYLNASKEDTGRTLASAASDGVYAGFIGAGSWENWWLKEGNGIIWGNIGDDGGGIPFKMSSNDMAWNFWYPGQNGCYYTVVNTISAEWSALWIPTLTVAGDIHGDMTYDRKSNKWTLTFEAASAGTKNITISGTGKQYNVATGTDDAAAIDTPVAFGGSADMLSFESSVSNIAVEVTAAGTATLEIDLNNPNCWTAVVNAGAAPEQPTVLPIVYLVGISDGNNSWTFSKYLRLYDENTLGYAGFANVDCPWGYQIAIESGNWSDVYKYASGDVASGTLVFAEGDNNNIPAPGTGLYFFDVSLGNMTYAHTAVGSEVYYAGFEDDWTLRPLTPTDEVGVYTATVTVSKETPWGVQIVLDQNWSVKLGGADGILLNQGSSNVSNIPFTETSGTFILEVDLINSTYSITQQ